MVYGITLNAASYNCHNSSNCTGKFEDVYLSHNTMNKKLSLLAISLFALNFSKADDRQKIVSKIQGVTVFLTGAQITRTATATITPGNSALVFEGLSPDVDAQSIQVKADGNFTILSVKNELNFLNQQTQQQRIKEIIDQKNAVDQKLQSQVDLMNVYHEEEKMLSKNQLVSGSNTNLDVAKLKLALDFQTLRLTELKKKEQVIDAQIDLLNKEIKKYEKQLGDISKDNGKPTGNIIVNVSSKSAASSTFTLTYVVKTASWYPTYDIRAKNVNSPVTIAYKANVSQSCGEEWNNIKLTLSTGNPSVNGSKPDLTPYYLGGGMNYDSRAVIKQVSGTVRDAKGNALSDVNVKVKGTSIGTVTDPNGYYSIQLPSGNQMLEFSYIGYEPQSLYASSENLNVYMRPATSSLNEVVTVGYGTAMEGRVSGLYVEPQRKVMIRGNSTVPVAVQQTENQTSVEFKIDNPYTIPNDGKQYLVEINQIDVPAEYQYYAAPKLSTDVFLTAKLINWNQYNFLSGEANLFFEGTYIGKSLLDTHSTADTLNLSLGVDKNIVVTRTAQKNMSDKQGLLGSSRKEIKDWFITVKNRKTQPVNLLIEDQVPVSQNSDINVDVQETSGAKIDVHTGRASWSLKLNPLDEKKLELRYQVKYPKNQTVIVQ